MPENHESLTFITPLNNEKTQYFLTNKKIGVPVSAQYTYNGKKYDTKALMTIDNFRSHCDYGMSYWWMNMQVVLPDGRPFALSLGDGIGSGYSGIDRASEDFASLQGRVYKLDQSVLTYDKENIMTSKQIKTMKNSYSSCELTYTPQELQNLGINLMVFAF